MENKIQAILDLIDPALLIEKNSGYERNASKRAGKMPKTPNQTAMDKLPRGSRRKLGSCSHIFDSVRTAMASNISDHEFDETRKSLKSLLENLDSLLIVLSSTRGKFAEAASNGAPEAEIRVLSDLEAKTHAKVKKIVAGVTEALEVRREIPPDSCPLKIMGGVEAFMPKWIELYLAEGFEACFRGSMLQDSPTPTANDRLSFNALQIAYVIKDAEARLTEFSGGF